MAGKFVIYHAYQNAIVPGSVLVTFDKESWVSKAIWFFTNRKNKFGARASHVVLCLDKFTAAESLFAEGFVKRSFKKYNEKKYEILVLTPTFDFAPSQMRSAAEAMINSTPYALGQLLGILLKKIFGFGWVSDWQSNAQICSEAVCNVYKNIGVDLFTYAKTCAEVYPVFYIMTSKFERVYDSRYTTKS